jgi:hypothetical protein
MGRNAVGSPAKLEYKSISTDVTSPQRSGVNPTNERVRRFFGGRSLSTSTG